MSLFLLLRKAAGDPTLALDLDFTTGSLDAGITFTRATSATYYNSSGVLTTAASGAARFDHDPVTLEAKGFLIEEARTNVVLRSAEFDSASWSKNVATVTADAVASPDGTTSADKIANSGTTIDYPLCYQAFTSTAAAWSQSVYAKAGTVNFITVGTYDGTTVKLSGVNLTTGVADVTAAGHTISTQDVGNGWWRITVLYTYPGTTGRIHVGLHATAGVLSYAPSAAGADYIYAWGAQAEAGSYPTSYIPTTTAAVTRNADVAVMTGTNFSDWFSASTGTIYAQWNPTSVSGTRPIVQFDDTTANELLALLGSTTNPLFNVTDGGVAQASVDAGTIAAGTAYKFAGAYAENDIAASIAGGAAVTDTSATLPTVTQARIGSDGTNYLNGAIAALKFYNTRKSNADLQTLTA